MKLLLSAYACEPNRGSEEGNGWNYVLNYTKLGYEVWCFTACCHQEKIEEELQKRPIPNLKFHFVEHPGWSKQVNAFLPWIIGIYLTYLGWQEEAYKVAAQLDREIEFDVVHHATYGSLQLGTALWRLHKPLIFGPVGGGQQAPAAFKKYFMGEWRNEVFRNWISKLLLTFNPNVRRTLQQAAIVYASNPDTYTIAHRLRAKNLHLMLDAGLPDDYFPSSLPMRSPSDKFRILWVGRLMSRKGLPLVLEALSKVSPEIPFHLTIVGDGPLRDQIPAWIETYGLQDKATWTGQIPWAAVKDAYQSHDLMMFCSLRDSGAAQFLEALAHSLPVLTLDLHGGKILVPDNAGIRVPAEHPEATIAALAKAVEHLYYHPEERVAMGAAGYQFAKQHTWSNRIATIDHRIKLLSQEKQGIKVVPPLLENAADWIPTSESD
jgi:glycosyltransferase involved in cell wall biosynthesis